MWGRTKKRYTSIWPLCVQATAEWPLLIIVIIIICTGQAQIVVVIIEANCMWLVQRIFCGHKRLWWKSFHVVWRRRAHEFTVRTAVAKIIIIYRRHRHCLLFSQSQIPMFCSVLFYPWYRKIVWAANNSRSCRTNSKQTLGLLFSGKVWRSQTASVRSHLTSPLLSTPRRLASFGNSVRIIYREFWMAFCVRVVSGEMQLADGRSHRWVF